MPSMKGPKRKRESDKPGDPVAPAGDGRPAKQPKRGDAQPSGLVKHALLAQYYPETLTLRAYVLGRLPPSSRLRRKKIASLGSTPSQASDGNGPSRVELVLSRLLDSALVAIREPKETPEPADDRWQKWITYSQKGDESYVTLSDGLAGAVFSQSEVVEFAIWLLFERAKRQGHRPRHLLCDGFYRNLAPRPNGAGATTIPGIFASHRNPHVEALKEPPWPQLLALLGKSGEKIMMDLLLDCAIFVPLEAGHSNYHQISGKPIYELEPLRSESTESPSQNARAAAAPRPPSEITFVRSRMLYARAALNARGLVHFGLRHIHVLNRLPYHDKKGDEGGDEKPGAEPAVDIAQHQTIHIMMYIFPRQFGLHNVFTSTVDTTKTAQKFQDYTLREEEIAEKFGGPKGGPLTTRGKQVPVPKRLKGPLKDLVEKLRILHSRCSYSELLQYYCPVQLHDSRARGGHSTNTKAPSASASAKSHGKRSKGQRKPRPPVANTEGELPSFSSLTEVATPISQVSAFCQAVMKKIIPNAFWGTGETQTHNQNMFLKNVDHFVRLRRFEAMNLHEVVQGLKMTDIEWLAPPRLKNQKLSQTDVQKRKEIFYEFLYYLIDSLLIPLIRSNFYVTESSVHRYRLFFFRHDIWRYVAEPAMASLKAKMFEEVKLEDALRILDSRKLGFSQVRLLPKKETVRPIMNLRRRMLVRGPKKILGPSINTILGPVHTVLNLEKSLKPARLGSTMFSVGDLYSRLKAFKQRARPAGQKFYFAKVDVQAAFDTIPQEAILAMMRKIPSHGQYEVTKHVELQQNVNYMQGAGPASASRTTSRRWRSSARPAGSTATAAESQLVQNRKNTVIVDGAFPRSYDTRALLGLLTSHVRQNLVKIGKKYFRQKEGIPQGSILSSILCNYFYAGLEAEHLSFLQGGPDGDNDCLLLRLIDDFLLITTNKSKACRFVEVMHGGLPRYGVTVSPDKSLVNFDLTINGAVVARTRDGEAFPYCGTLLDCQTLEITRDRDKPKDPVIFNSLTVEYSRYPGYNFKRKVLNAFKIQSHLMYFDTSHNSARTTLDNIHNAFAETATKAWAYARCLPRARQPPARILIETIKELVKVSFLLLTSRFRTRRYPGYKCAVSKSQVARLAMHAFLGVLEKKQSGYGEVIAWLRQEIQGPGNRAKKKGEREKSLPALSV